MTVAGEDRAVWTFEVTQGARVYGVGASHESRVLRSSGRPTTLDGFVREGQRVTVHYREQDGTRYVKELRVSGRVAQPGALTDRVDPRRVRRARSTRPRHFHPQ